MAHGKGRAYAINARKNAISKRKHIVRDCMQSDPNWDIRLQETGRLSKNKVHCSCPLCSVKTRKNGYTHSDKKKMLRGLDDWD